MSPKVPSETVNISGYLIKENLVLRVNAACSISVLADGTTDIACIEQLTICSRYLNNEINYIEQAFMWVVPVQDQRGRNVAETIIQFLINLAISREHPHGKVMTAPAQWPVKRMSRSFRLPKIPSRIVHSLRQQLSPT